jgi:hypothetical protein
MLIAISRGRGKRIGGAGLTSATSGVDHSRPYGFRRESSVVPKAAEFVMTRRASSVRRNKALEWFAAKIAEILKRTTWGLLRQA